MQVTVSYLLMLQNYINSKQKYSEIKIIDCVKAKFQNKIFC